MTTITLNRSQQVAVRAHTAIELSLGWIIDWNDLGQTCKQYFDEIGKDNDVYKIYNFRTDNGKMQTLIHLKKTEEGWVATGGLFIDTRQQLETEDLRFRFHGEGLNFRAEQVESWHVSMRELLNARINGEERLEELEEHHDRYQRSYEMWYRRHGWGEE